MIDTTKARTDAEEGLRIAEFVTPEWRDEAGYNNTGCPTRFFCVPGNNLGTKVEMHAADSAWAVDSRTRSPAAYRNVIALAEEVERLRAEAERWRRDAIEDTPSREVLVDIRSLLSIKDGQSTKSAIEYLLEELRRMTEARDRAQPIVDAAIAWSHDDGDATEVELFDAIDAYERSLPSL